MRSTRPNLFNEYDERWPQEFQEEKRRIQGAFKHAALKIQHIGSTSVPGMPGKGIIDILITVEHLEPSEKYDTPLRSIGYINRPVPDRTESPFYTRPSEKPRTHNVHIATMESSIAKNHVIFRDYLRSNRDAFKRYEECKRSLLRAAPADWERYSNEKLKLVTDLLREAQKWHRSHTG